jgi:hypothetical protein
MPVNITPEKEAAGDPASIHQHVDATNSSTENIPRASPSLSSGTSKKNPEEVDEPMDTVSRQPVSKLKHSKNPSSQESFEGKDDVGKVLI